MPRRLSLIAAGRESVQPISNRASWLNNRELDVIVEDERFAKLMEQSYLDDLCGSTEIVLQKRHPRPRTKNIERSRMKKIIPAGSATRTAAGVMRLGHAVGAAIGNRRELGPAEIVIMLWGSGVLLAIAAIAAYWPRVLAFPAAVICVWFALSLLVRSVHLRSMALHSGQREHMWKVPTPQITEGAKTGIIIIRTVAIESASFLFAGSQRHGRRRPSYVRWEPLRSHPRWVA